MNFWKDIASHRRAWLTGLFGFLAWSAVFALIYAQSPLFSSNQNQYFLHGLARSGFGDLGGDWLANTLDPTPVFSGLVFITYSLTRQIAPFYVYYALLMGVYLASLYGIADALFGLRGSRVRTLAFLALMLAVHSAGLHFVLTGLGPRLTYLLEGGVADQRLLGQVFQPSTFGVFLLLSICLYLNGRRTASIAALLAAVYFHPTYLLSAGLLTLAYMLIDYRESRSLRAALQLGAIVLAAVLPVVIYTAIVFGPTNEAAYREAQDVLVNFRIPQHAIIANWLDWTAAFQAAWVLAAGLVIRKTRLFSLYLTLALGALALTGLQALTGSNTLALIFPWRVSAVLVPLATASLIAAAVTRIPAAPAERGAWITPLGLGLIAVLIVVGVLRFRIEAARKESDPARPMMAYVAAHRSAGDVYLIPGKMMDFRLATGAPIYGDFNSIPYRDLEVLAWYRRVRRSNLFYARPIHACEVLSELMAARAVTHVVLPAEGSIDACGSFPVVYRDSAYTLYALK